jgi:hypothetical protein
MKKINRYYPKINSKHLCQEICKVIRHSPVFSHIMIGSMLCQGCSNCKEYGETKSGRLWIKCSKIKEATKK